MPVTIRKAVIEDANIIAPLFNEYRIFYGQLSNIAGAQNFIKERLLNNESVIFLAYNGEDAIGFVQLYPIFTSVGMQRTWLLNDLFVQEKARGKGIGILLLEASKELGKNSNSTWIMLQTQNTNYAAQTLYEKNGWIKMDDIFYSFLL